jgi:hypothetical protein
MSLIIGSHLGPYERCARVGGVIRKGTCGDRAVAANSKSYKLRK